MKEPRQPETVKQHLEKTSCLDILGILLTLNTIQGYKNAADRNILRLANKIELKMELWTVISGISGFND